MVLFFDEFSLTWLVSVVILTLRSSLDKKENEFLCWTVRTWKWISAPSSKLCSLVYFIRELLRPHQSFNWEEIWNTRKHVKLTARRARFSGCEWTLHSNFFVRFASNRPTGPGNSLLSTIAIWILNSKLLRSLLSITLSVSPPFSFLLLQFESISYI